jgi:hypothetical protein
MDTRMNPLPKDLADLVEQFAWKHVADNKMSAFSEGATFLWQAIVERAGKVDEKAAESATIENQWAIDCPDCGSLMPDTKAFVRGARWQHALSFAALEAMRSKIQELEREK